MLLATFGGSGHASDEANLKKKEAISPRRRTGIGRRRVDFCAGGERIGIGRADGRHTTDAELCTESGDHAQ
jgi:hypothetical protein